MEFETLKKSYKKEIIIGIVVLILIGITLLVKSAFAKYELVKNIKIAEGTINYKVPDFKIMAMYKDDGAGYTEIETMPGSDYAINKEKSYCTLDNENKIYNKMYTDEDGNHVISELSKNSKCYLYFDNYKKVNTALGEITVKLATPDFSKTSCSEGCGESTVGIYQARDDDGMSYYYRGDVTNNYVKFGGFYWRIIRVNGDGTIRLIYDGTTGHANGEITEDSIAIADQKYNEIAGRSEYVGWTYEEESQRPINDLNATESNAKKQVESWYSNNIGNNSTYSNKIADGKFCNDRNTIAGRTWVSKPTSAFSYASFIRLTSSNEPTLLCLNSDIYKLKTGLITGDEARYAGAVRFITNNTYYLYNGQDYWTMTPGDWDGNGAGVSVVKKELGFAGHDVNAKYGIRPVINLRSDTTITFSETGEKGTISNPYVVS